MKNIWVPLSGQVAQQKKVETIANNIANANTAGFKRDDIVFKEHLTALTEKGTGDIDIPREDWTPDDFYRTRGSQNAFVKVDGTFTVHKQGELVPTKNNLDLALNGQGFFEVLTPAGARYTRNGTFSIDKEGFLVTSRGSRVLSKLTEQDTAKEAATEDQATSRFIKIDDAKKLSISKNGDLYSTAGMIGSISVVEFKDIHALKKQGNSLYINNSEKNIVREDTTTSVNQGFVEQSNVNALREMSELIQAHRHFNSIQKAINSYDAISKRAVNEISRF